MAACPTPDSSAPDNLADAAAIAERVVEAAVTHDLRTVGDLARTFPGKLIKTLHQAFEREYPPPAWRVFSGQVDSGVKRGDGKKRGIHEMLYDLSVIEWGGTTVSPGAGTILPVFGRPLWQVEWERSTNTRGVAFDFGKLVQGGAPNKLLVTTERRSVQRFNAFLVGAAKFCTGHLVVAYVPDYNSSEFKPLGRGMLRGLWVFDGGAMRQVRDRRLAATPP